MHFSMQKDGRETAAVPKVQLSKLILKLDKKLSFFIVRSVPGF